MNIIKRKGASILEAIIASVIILISVVAYSNVQIGNFISVTKSNQNEQVSYALTDFTDKIRTQISGRGDTTQKERIINDYLAIPWNVTASNCSTNIPDYINDCLNENTNAIPLCDTEKSMLFDVYEMSCKILPSSPNAIVRMDYCAGSAVNLCIWVNMDGENRDEATCRNNFQSCQIMEIKP